MNRSVVSFQILPPHILAVAVLGILPGSTAFSADEMLLTVAESSNFTATCTSQQCDTFVSRCADRAAHVERFSFGATFDDRDMVAALMSQPRATLATRDDRLRILVIGNIHSGECAGKEALLMLLREVSEQQSHEWLKNSVVVFAPNYNADANDQMDVDNRPGQIGPAKGMGRRANSQGYDLNRDFMKLESPEAKSLVRLMTEFDPHIFIDCHTTNGSRHRYELTYDIPHNPATSAAIRSYLRKEMMPRVTSQLKRDEIDTFFYGNFDEDHQLWVTYGYEPRYSTEYFGLRGRLAILSEAYSYISFEDRIQATRAFVRGCIEDALEHREQIVRLTTEFDQRQSSVAPDASLSLAAKLRPFPDPATILGYKDDEPFDYECTFLGDYESTVDTPFPSSWLVPEELPEVVALLRAHGIQMTQLAEPITAAVETDTVTEIRRSTRQFQGHYLQSVTTVRNKEMQTVPEGTWQIPASQPLGRLAGYLLEAQAADGIVAWNLIDDHLKQGAAYPIRRLAN